MTLDEIYLYFCADLLPKLSGASKLGELIVLIEQ